MASTSDDICPARDGAQPHQFYSTNPDGRHSYCLFCLKYKPMMSEHVPGKTELGAKLTNIFKEKIKR